VIEYIVYYPSSKNSTKLIIGLDGKMKQISPYEYWMEIVPEIKGCP